jgi:hypothetical protein
VDEVSDEGRLLGGFFASLPGLLHLVEVLPSGSFLPKLGKAPSTVLGTGSSTTPSTEFIPSEAEGLRARLGAGPFWLLEAKDVLHSPPYLLVLPAQAQMA